MYRAAITPAGVRDELVAWCADAADRHLHKAAEFRGRERNLAAFHALEAVADELARLPGHDPGLRRLAAARQAVGADARPLAISEQRRALWEFDCEGAATAAALLSMLTAVVDAILDVGYALKTEPVEARRLPRSA